jgi:hypothetical protein
MKLDHSIVERHKQLAVHSCIPMSIELVLKLLGRVPPDFYCLQEQWGDRKDGTFGDFDGKTIRGLTFRLRFPVQSGRGFPAEKLTLLFDTIDRELGEDRFVIVSLAVPCGWHNFVVYERTDSGEYLATSKSTSSTWPRTDVRSAISAMTGTDILTYSLDDETKLHK